MTTSRLSYDTLLISMYMHGREHLVPEHVRQRIPSSTAAGFRARRPDHYVGNELRHIQRDMLVHHELMLRHRHLNRVLRIVTSTWLAFVKVGAGELLRGKTLREWVVENVQEMSCVLPRSMA